MVNAVKTHYIISATGRRMNTKYSLYTMKQMKDNYWEKSKHMTHKQKTKNKTNKKPPKITNKNSHTQ